MEGSGPKVQVTIESGMERQCGGGGQGGRRGLWGTHQRFRELQGRLKVGRGEGGTEAMGRELV